MLHIDFASLKRKAHNRVSARASTDEECINGVLRICHNINELLMDMQTSECAMAIMSLGNWVNRKEFKTCKQTPRIGDVFYADLGNAYKPEMAYPHPVLVIGEIGNHLMIIPVSSAPYSVANAYHPTTNPKGNKFARKVLVADGFDCDSALLISSVRTISGGRLLAFKSHIANNALLDEVKDVIFQHVYGKAHIKLLKAEQEIVALRAQLNQKN